MPKSELAYYTREGMQGTEFVTLDPVSRERKVLATHLPEGIFVVGPTEDFLFFSIREKGPAEKKEIQQILVPDDRQPGWRDRGFIHRYDLRTGLLQRLTYGHRSTYINDISRDGRYMLFSCREPRLTERPFSTSSLYRMDLATLKVDTLIEDEPFMGRALFSPDASQLLIDGSGEAFDGIGLKIKEGQTSNMSDTQLFLYDIAGKKVRPLTKDFDPSVDDYTWSAYDKKVYLIAKNRDRVCLYVLDPAKDEIRALPEKEDVVMDFSLAAASPELVYYGMSASNSQRLYTCDLRKGATTCLADLSGEDNVVVMYIDNGNGEQYEANSGDGGASLTFNMQKTSDGTYAASISAAFDGGPEIAVDFDGTCVSVDYVPEEPNEFTYEGTTEAVRSALVDKRDPDIWHVWLSAVGGLDELSEFEDSYNEAIHITAPAEAFNAGSVGFSTYKEILKFEYAGQTWQYAEDNSVRGTLEVGLEGEQLTVDFTNYDNFSGHYSGTAVIVE